MTIERIMIVTVYMVWTEYTKYENTLYYPIDIICLDRSTEWKLKSTIFEIFKVQIIVSAVAPGWILS